jgi:hypothetical protein
LVSVSARRFPEYVGDVDSLLGWRRSYFLGRLWLAYGKQMLLDVLGLGHEVAVILRDVRFPGSCAVV